MIEINNYKFSMDNYLVNNLNIILEEAIPNKWDAVFLIFGREGSGKTTFATQAALYCDNSFNMERCVFTPEQFIEAVDNAKDEQSILWDEAIFGAKISQQASSIAQTIVNKLTTIRRKRLKIFLCFPYMYMLNKYFVSRCIASIYVYAKDFNDRGYMRFYDSGKTEHLYNLMKMKYRYNWVLAMQKIKPSFFCKYSKVLCLPEAEYDRKKELSTLETEKKLGVRETVWKNRAARLATWTHKKQGISQFKLAKIIDIPAPNLSRLITDKVVELIKDY